METGLQEFQYKLLNDIMFKNEKLSDLKLIHLCAFFFFCKKEVESLKHLLFYCRCMEAFWQAVTSWLRKQNIFVDTVTLMTISFGEYSEKQR